MAGLNWAQRRLCDEIGMDPSRLWALRRAHVAVSASLVDVYDPVDVALIAGYRQGLAYARKVLDGVAQGDAPT